MVGDSTAMSIYNILTNLYLVCGSYRVNLMDYIARVPATGATTLLRDGAVGLDGPPSATTSVRYREQDGEQPLEHYLKPRNITLNTACIGPNQNAIATQKYNLYRLLSNASLNFANPGSNRYVELHAQTADGRDLVMYCLPDDNGVTFGASLRNGISGTLTLKAFDPTWYSNQQYSNYATLTANSQGSIQLTRNGGDLPTFPIIGYAGNSINAEIYVRLRYSNSSDQTYLEMRNTANNSVGATVYTKPGERRFVGSGYINPSSIFQPIPASGTAWYGIANTSGQITVYWRDRWSAL